MKISVLQVAGEHCVTVAEGWQLYRRLIPEVRAGWEVELDFAGVGAVGAPFLNASLGFLLRDFEVEELCRLVKVSNVPPAAKNGLRRVVQNSKRFYQRSSVESARQNKKLQGVNLSNNQV